MSAACESCAALAEQNHALQQRAVEEFEKREAVVDQLVSARNTIAGLKGELTKLRTDSPKMADAEEVFRFWVARLGKNARTNFGPKRQEKVLARLKEKSSHSDLERKEDLKWAVRGCEAMPWSGNYARWPSPGPGRTKKDGLEVVCHDETSVERFMRYANDQADGAFRSLVAALERRFGRVYRVDEEGSGQPIVVVSECPVCGVPDALVGNPGRAWCGSLLRIECLSGCVGDKVCERLRERVHLKVAA